MLLRLTWICADQGAVKGPLRNARIEGLEEGPHADGHQGGEDSIEGHIEDSDFGCDRKRTGNAY